MNGPDQPSRPSVREPLGGAAIVGRWLIALLVAPAAGWLVAYGLLVAFWPDFEATRTFLAAASLVGAALAWASGGWLRLTRLARASAAIVALVTTPLMPYALIVGYLFLGGDIGLQ